VTGAEPEQAVAQDEAHAEPAAEPQPTAEAEPEQSEPEQSAPEKEPEHEKPVPVAATGAADQATTEQQAVGHVYTSKGRRKLFGRRKGVPFVDEPGQCAVCGSKLKVANQDKLAASNWIVVDDAGLCTRCQAEGWDWADGAALPLRHGTGERV
jgi:hypothetical protein